MTASMTNFPNGAYGNMIDGFVYPQFIGYAMRSPTTNDVYQPGTRWQDNSVSPPVIYQTVGGGLWQTAASNTFTSLTVNGASTLTGTTNINTTGSAVTSIGTGGTGVTNIGNATGNTAVTGSLTSSTSLTATLGNITASNGNIVRGTAGNKDTYQSVATTITAGANSAGTVTLSSGAAIVSTTAVTANSQIRLYRQGIGATGAAALGMITLFAKTAGTSFEIRAVTTAAANATATTDVSVIAWEIVN